MFIDVVGVGGLAVDDDDPLGDIELVFVDVVGIVDGIVVAEEFLLTVVNTFVVDIVVVVVVVVRSGGAIDPSHFAILRSTVGL